MRRIWVASSEVVGEGAGLVFLTRREERLDANHVALLPETSFGKAGLMLIGELERVAWIRRQGRLRVAQELDLARPTDLGRGRHGRL